MEDLELLARWRAGDVDAGQLLFGRHLETLHRFFRNKVSGNIQDLIQQTMLACLESEKNFQQRSSFRSYLLGVARNQLFEYYRRNKSDNERFEAHTVTVHDLGMSPSSQMAQHREERLLLEALRHLPIDLQIALELSYWEQLTGPELAEILDIPLDTAYSRLRRAKQLLRETLATLSQARALEATQTGFEQWAEGLRTRAERPRPHVPPSTR